MKSTQQPTLLIFTALMISVSSLHPSQALSSCRNLCGTIAINYPFGVDDGCGAPQYRKMLNCNSSDLFFVAQSGNYKVRSIDYDKQTMVVYDPGMSTCTTLQPHHDFILTDIQSVVMPPTPDTIFALLNCSIDSPVLNRYKSLCFNFSSHNCDELYNGCSAFKIFHVNGTIGVGGTNPPCCFTGYNTAKLMNMDILDCSHYTTMYNVDEIDGGEAPMDWSYGIELSFVVPKTGCELCQGSGGTCGFDIETEMTLCLCSISSNSTRQCGE
ncbi:hypothetical protein Syun_008169 [Stephania yunnanensis]|uniref:Wall-associated receptor kinase galacturonan-binding domain-containing protein n=1 Tax=Stephania yunnanensis TaxID=152371 RepID=A0AAP0PZH7_9MAGN